MKQKQLPAKKPEKKNVAAVVVGPARDEKALIFPISAIKLGKNVRDKLEHIEELAASIKTSGLLQPLVIVKVTAGFELVAGQRRLAALKLLGEKQAPVRLVGADASQIGIIRLVENLQRDQLSALETVFGIHALGREFKTQRELAGAIGKTESYVSQCIAVVRLLEERKLQRVEVEGLPLRELFARLANGGASRKPSGPQPGGRFVEGAIQLKNTAASGKFTLRISYDPERTPKETRAKILETLKALVAKLEAGVAEVQP
jgi:ParB/RepB/Spo0J family partition protein